MLSLNKGGVGASGKDLAVAISPVRFVVAASLLALLSCVVFYHGLGGGFVLDDLPNIVENTSVHLRRIDAEALLYAAYSFQPGGGSRPLAMLSFALDYWRGGLDPQVFKFTNLVIHALTVVALACFFRAVLVAAAWPVRSAQGAALLLAGIWAVHPLQVSSVLYVVQRMQTLATLWMVLGLYTYFRARLAQIEGGPSRTWWGSAVLCWGLAFLCKEDSALLPAYTWALEITVLGFRAKDGRVSRLLRKVYGTGVLVGAALFLLVVVPHYWHWDAYPGRDFSSYERLLTQGRVLAMYLGQILAPIPASLPFYYDGLEPSRSLLQPLTTLPALLLIIAMVVLAWRMRRRRPLFALGAFVFLIGHFVSSNVIPLELAFEHRNHFPLIGVVLAFGDLFAWAFASVRVIRPYTVPVAAGALLVYGGLCASRVHAWAEPLRFAQESVAYAPYSVRARLVLCTKYFDLSGSRKDSPYFDLAIRTCEDGGGLPDGVTLLHNVVIYKSIKGTVNQADWDRFLASLRTATMSAQNKKIVWVTINNATRKNPPLDEAGVLETIEIVASRAQLSANDYLRMAEFILNESSRQELGYKYLVSAVNVAPANDPDILKMLSQLDEAGYGDWVGKLRQLLRDQGKLDDQS